MSQVQEQPTEQAAQEPVDIFADGFSESDISAMYDTQEGDTPAPAEDSDGEQPGAEPEGDSPKDADAEKPAEPEKAEEKEQPDAYELPLFGKNVKLTGDQLIQAAEAGIQLMQQRPQVEKAMQLMQAVQQDTNLQAVLQAYSQGKPLPQMHNAAPAKPAAVPANPEEAFALLQQQIMEQAAPGLIQQIMQAVEAKYKPFVEDVNSFAAEARREKAFAKYQADPDYSDVNSLMTQNLQAKVAEGAISMQQAAEIDAKLKADPDLYGQWFGKFKTALKNAQKQAAAAPQPVQTVPHAPKLESSAAAAPTNAEKMRVAMARALDGDPNGFNDLYENQ